MNKCDRMNQRQHMTRYEGRGYTMSILLLINISWELRGGFFKASFSSRYNSTAAQSFHNLEVTATADSFRRFAPVRPQCCCRGPTSPLSNQRVGNNPRRLLGITRTSALERGGGAYHHRQDPNLFPKVSHTCQKTTTRTRKWDFYIDHVMW